MRLFQDTSIRRKQMLIIMGTSSVALFLACAAFVTYDILSFKKTLVSKLSSLATIISDANEAAVNFGEGYRDEAEKALANLRKEKHIVRAYLYQYQDERPASSPVPLAAYRRDAGDQRPPPQTAFGKQLRFGDRYFAISAPVIHLDQNDRSHIVGRIDLESDLDELYDRLGRYVTIVAGVLATSLLVAFVLSSSLQSVISEPILYLADVARSV